MEVYLTAATWYLTFTTHMTLRLILPPLTHLNFFLSIYVNDFLPRQKKQSFLRLSSCNIYILKHSSKFDLKNGSKCVKHYSKHAKVHIMGVWILDPVFLLHFGVSRDKILMMVLASSPLIWFDSKRYVKPSYAAICYAVVDPCYNNPNNNNPLDPMKGSLFVG